MVELSFSISIGARQDIAAARSAQGLVRREVVIDVGDYDGVGIKAGGNTRPATCAMVGTKIGADLVGNGAKARPVDDTRE